MDVVYEITCDICQDLIEISDPVKESRRPRGQGRVNYVGMTSTSAHCRMASHLTGLKAKSAKNPLHRHDVASHDGVSQKYTMRILCKEKSLLPLSITEVLYIEKQVPMTTLDDRN